MSGSRTAYPAVICAVFVSFAAASADPPSPGDAPPAPALKQITAQPVRSDEITIDGRLVEIDWASAAFDGGFSQREPIQGAEPSTPTRIAVLFDENALYIAARMSSSAARSIRREITRHDALGSAERFLVSLDTYHDRRTAYTFVVTAAGGTAEYYHADDQESLRDFSYNPVWDAGVQVDDDGWSVEMRIPFSQLRFNAEGDQVWGINVGRWIPDRNEDDYWVVIPKDESAWASRFGQLVGLHGIHAPTRIELLPYATVQAHVSDRRTSSDPFARTFRASGGLDATIGLAPGISLDATFNPDFGQVDADPAQVNLTDFELVLEERRPFFVEGADLLTGGGTKYYYSRRIGGAPHVAVDGNYTETALNTTILGALKLTGRTEGGLSLAALAAVTDRELGRSMDTATREITEIEVEPLTAYGAFRAQQEFGSAHSSVGATVTTVGRDMVDGSPADRTLARTAVTGGADLTLRSADGAWRLDANVGGSVLHGSTNAMIRLQRSSARYYQRPDAAYVVVDSGRTSLLGYVSGITLSRMSGRWQGYLKGRIESPGLELNDIGRIGSADEYAVDARLSWLETVPTPLYHSLRIDAGLVSEWNHGWTRTSTIASLIATMKLPTFWIAQCSTSIDLPATSTTLTRGGPAVSSPIRLAAMVSLQNDPSSKFGWHGTFAGRFDGAGGRFASMELGGRALLGEQWQTELRARTELLRDPWQYVTSLADGPSETYGRRYLFAELVQNTAVLQLRLGYAATPTVSIDLYAEPYYSVGRYTDLGELTSGSSASIRRYAANGAVVQRRDPQTVEVFDRGARLNVRMSDFTYTSFRMNLVLRWEWLPGSTLYAVFQRNAEDRELAYSPVRPTSVLTSPGIPGSQVFALKVAYWLPVE